MSGIVELGGLSVSRVTAVEVVDHVFGALAKGHGGWLITANLDFVQRAAELADIRDLYARADLILADGTPLLWAARLKGQRLPERVAGSDLVWLLAERAAREGRSVYLLGGSGDTAARGAKRLQQQIPDLRIKGVSSPWLSLPPTSDEIEQIRTELLHARPDLVYAGFGSPKQEHVIDALRADLPAAWMMGCGISLSFLAGDIPRAPHWMRRTGLEWFHRMLQEPRRLGPRYLFRNLPFALRLLWEARRARLDAPPCRDLR